MRAIKAIVEGNSVRLLEPTGLEGRHEAVLVVEDQSASGGDQQWAQIAKDAAARPKFDEFLKQADREIAEGNTHPLDPDHL